jgi:hypothetical protein
MNNQYFTKAFRSGDFSRFLAERLTLTGCFAKSLLRFRDLLIMFYGNFRGGYPDLLTANSGEPLINVGHIALH